MTSMNIAPGADAADDADGDDDAADDDDRWWQGLCRCYINMMGNVILSNVKCIVGAGYNNEDFDVCFLGDKWWWWW